MLSSGFGSYSGGSPSGYRFSKFATRRLYIASVCSSATILARRAESLRRSSFSASGSFANASYDGNCENGQIESEKLSNNATGRAPTCAFICKPASVASCMCSITRRQRCGKCSCCNRVSDRGRPDASTIRRSIANSLSVSSKSETSCKTPLPISPKPFAIVVSSLSAAPKVGV